MSLPLFIAETELPEVGCQVQLTGAEGRHAATVRRIEVGEEILIADGQGGCVRAEAVTVGKHDLSATVRHKWQEPQPAPRVTVVQALPKSAHAELAVDQAVQAGADEIVPWAAQRCITRWQGAKATKARDKWRTTAAAAAKQSRRAWIPQVTEQVSGKQLCALVAEKTAAGAIAVVLHESATDGFAEAIAGADEASDVLLIIGPEGGVSDTELAELTAAGARTAVLGPTVLRTSAAAAVALGALGVLTQRW
ncbi:16S rRNA (uracil(1498)-N(3))-methyltransferase [Corynebacterium sp. TAE3-ERU12]|uniref:16S rRNA (uracil(1498)-N(3))-methyltransferase n=1 Tax=Corynebacterium sp. TAE3-ERU12 TaxID=2849491 RepID=UPI001C4918F5|nr:16S rRNA (uracil(1498)-N(3))-methyltransferase [Corynebacterium sp. TAE3-ERU12]MBV7295770.1 16S rRNA (uracil(1498)-N(3))-methyltransferase [Corynebacterium sp. TAE3-ERU12]